VLCIFCSGIGFVSLQSLFAVSRVYNNNNNNNVLCYNCRQTLQRTVSNICHAGQYIIIEYTHTAVQNAAARFLTGARRREHVSPVLRQLHWLPIQTRVNFKLACFVFSSLSGHAPSYLSDNIHLVSEGPRRRLRSSTDRSCDVPRTHNTFGDRSFAVAGPHVWNSLPGHIRDENIT